MNHTSLLPPNDPLAGALYTMGVQLEDPLNIAWHGISTRWSPLFQKWFSNNQPYTLVVMQHLQCAGLSEHDSLLVVSLYKKLMAEWANYGTFIRGAVNNEPLVREAIADYIISLLNRKIQNVGCIKEGVDILLQYGPLPDALLKLLVLAAKSGNTGMDGWFTPRIGWLPTQLNWSELSQYIRSANPVPNKELHELMDYPWCENHRIESLLAAWLDEPDGYFLDMALRRYLPLVKTNILDEHTALIWAAFTGYIAKQPSSENASYISEWLGRQSNFGLYAAYWPLVTAISNDFLIIAWKLHEFKDIPVGSGESIPVAGLV